jgi:hypothetical protein
VAFGTPLFVTFGRMTVCDPAVNRWVPGRLPPVFERIRAALHSTDVHPAYPYNGFGETMAALRISRLFLSRGKDVSFRRASTLAWEDLKERDLVLLGSPKSVPQMKEFRELQTRLAFDIGEDAIINFHPAPGEPAAYPGSVSSDVPVYDTYALVTRLRG